MIVPIGETIRVPDWRMRRFNDHLPLVLPDFILTITPELVRYAIRTQRRARTRPVVRKRPR